MATIRQLLQLPNGGTSAFWDAPAFQSHQLPLYGNEWTLLRLLRINWIRSRGPNNWEYSGEALQAANWSFIACETQGSVVRCNNRRWNWKRLRKNGLDNSTFRSGTINVGNYNNKLDEIEDMMKERKLDVLGMAETKHRGESARQDLADGYILIYCGVDAGIRKHGVAMIVGSRLAPYIQKVQLVSESLMRYTIRVKNKNSNIYQIYAPHKRRITL